MVSDENQDFLRDVITSGTDTFLDFHQCIQENLNYDPSQLASFFITNENWEKQKEITLIDMVEDTAFDTETMDRAVIGETVSEVNDRMIYVFDFFSERAFFIELIEKSDQKTGKKTPFVAHAQGQAPEQLTMDMLGDTEETGMDQEFDEKDEDRDDLWLDDIDPDSLDPDDF